MISNHNFKIFYLFTGLSNQSKDLTWGSHVNKSFNQINQHVFENDTKLLQSGMKAYQKSNHFLDFKTVFIFPYGLCAHFLEYDTNKDFFLWVYDVIEIESMFVLLTDPAMLTHSNIDQQSHQGIKIFGLEKGYRTIYNVEVVIEDSDNPTERDSCSLDPYEDCVDQQTKNIFFQVKTYKCIFSHL